MALLPTTSQLVILRFKVVYLYIITQSIVYRFLRRINANENDIQVVW
jgi:hypothetical protein